MKHAFLIMAHANYALVSRLLKKLDHPDNTVYVHIDAKSRFSTEDKELLVGSCQFSEVIMVDRYRVNWGGYSQINIEMRMLERASSDKYDYYHFLSGVDFPTKSMEYIHTFFRQNAGYEFVHIGSDEFSQCEAYRYRLYHLFQEQRGREKNLYAYLEKAVLLVQRILGVNRAKKHPHIAFKSGSNWVSITHEFVTYLLSKQKQIQGMFSYSCCCDEFFLQTILYDSPFKDKVFSVPDKEAIAPNLRSIDWERGNKELGSPYTYTVRDYQELVASKNLFCRKVTDSTPEGNALIEKLEQL